MTALTGSAGLGGGLIGAPGIAMPDFLGGQLIIPSEELLQEIYDEKVVTGETAVGGISLALQDPEYAKKLLEEVEKRKNASSGGRVTSSGLTSNKNFSQHMISTYDTGGYTGDWNSTSGRIAVLHQKELVLNQSDTANILSAVSAIRSIAGLNNSINEAMMQGISRMMLEMTGMKANVNYNTEASQSAGDTIYEIHAEFPDANDVNSIREAILSLPNLASQKVLKY